MSVVPRTFLPSDEAIAAWTNLDDAVKWAELDELLWAGVTKQLGDEGLNNFVLLAAIAPEDVREAAEAVSPSPIVRAKVKLIYAAARLRSGSEPLDCMARPAVATGNVPGSSGDGPQRDGSGDGATKKGAVLKVRVATVLDQASDREVEYLDRATLHGCRRNFRLKEGDNPLEQEEVTDAQLSALVQVVRAGGVPYADFGVWGPYGNRLAKAQRFSEHFMDSDGKMKLREMRGPGDLAAWEKAWRVFRTAALMTGLATAAVLDVYAARFKQRVERHPNAWATCVLADVRCRSEWWEHEHRRQVDFHASSPELSGLTRTPLGTASSRSRRAPSTSGTKSSRGPP